MQKIVRKEGFRALWRGLDAALLMAVPVGIYMPLYDIVMARVDTGNPAAPLYAGAIARMAAVLLTSPLELIRTRMQAILHPTGGAAGSAMPALANVGGLWSHLALAPGEGALRQIQGMWRGVGATLARDVPFSAVYWGLLEPIRHSMLPADGRPVTSSQTIAANVLAGSIGGAAAAVITQPLDVVKTRKQLAAGRPVSTLGTLSAIAREEGMRGLLNGAFPRAMKAAPACAIVLASYECMKLAFKEKTANRLETIL
jgi:solute carrier family 25 protein 39/40